MTQKIAILGAAHQHLNYVVDEVNHRDDLELVAASEPDAALRERFLTGVDIPLYGSEQELFADHAVDAVMVAGVYNDRAAQAVAALHAGAHVLSDKPLCTTVDQLEMLREAADTTRRHVSILFEKRFYPATIGLRRLLDDGVLGELSMIASTGPHRLRRHTRPGWFLDPSTYGSIAADLPIHDIDLALSLTGARHGTVSGLAGNSRPQDHPGFDDHVALLLQAGTVPATIEASWLSPEAAADAGHYRMRVTGSDGTAELDWTYPRLTVTTHRDATWDEPLGSAPRPAQYFFDALAVGREPEISTDQSLLATEVALKSVVSARQGGAQVGF